MNKILLSLIIIIANFNINAQFLNIEVDNSSNTPNYLSEPFVAFNPDNPDNIIIGTNLSFSYYSVNGGDDWTKVTLTSEDYGVWGDPCVITDEEGNFYFFHLSNPPSDGSWIDRVVCQKTSNNGASWSAISTVGLNSDKKHDKETATVDRANGNIYLTWTQMDAYHSSDVLDKSIIQFASSTDRGQTWSIPKRISQFEGTCDGGSNMLRSAIPCVGPNGEVYVSWAGKKSNGDLAIVFDKSTDYGQTWLDTDIIVSDFPGGSHFFIPGIYPSSTSGSPSAGAGWPNTACDTSGGIYNGTIYINWADQRNGSDDTDIWLSKSTDNGLTWSSPKRVNNDEAGKHQFFTWMTVDQVTGNLFFIFYDRRNHSDNSTDVYMAISTDGGETFTNEKISASPFIPTDDVFFGDYSNIIAYNNMVRPVWTRLDGGVISIMTAIVDYPNNIKYYDETCFEDIDIYPNPSMYESYFSFKLKKRTELTLKVFDIYGKEVCTLINKEFLDAGKHVSVLNTENYNLSSGIYYFSLFAENKFTTKKFVINK